MSLSDVSHPRSRSRIFVVFRNDDPSAISDPDHERRIFDLFEKYGVPQTLGVIPNVSLSDLRDPVEGGERSLLQNPEMVEFLKSYAARSGSEIALHGYTHRTNRLSIPGRRDFFEFQRIPKGEQLEMMKAGMDILEQAFGVRPATFIPPWNRMDQNTIQACREAGLRIVSGHSYTAVSSDMFSFGTNTDLPGFASDLAAARQSTNRVFLSVLLHSATMRSREAFDQLTGVLESLAGTPDVECGTISQAIARWPEEVRAANDAGRNAVSLHEAGGSSRASVSPYVNVIPGLKRFSGIGRLMDVARAHYRRGEYQLCSEIGRHIDRRAFLVLAVIRLFLLTVGAALAWLGADALRRAGFSSAVVWLWILPFLTAAVTLLAARRVSALETRRELAFAGGLCAAGMMGALTAGYYFSA